MIHSLPKSLIETAKIILESTKHPMIDVDGVMKHMHNSEGNTIHNTAEGVRNFHKWFGDSKAVDEHGRPLVVYHGTNKKINEFKSMIGNRSKMVNDWSAIHFTNDMEQAKSFARSISAIEGGEPNIIKSYIKSINPTKYGEYHTKEDASKAGHDSRLTENNVGLQEWSVFEPYQVKSIDNIGSFDHPTNINESVSPLKFTVDNPGGDWLDYKQKQARSFIAKHGNEKSSLGKGFSGAVTGYFNKPLNLPVRHLSNLPGAMGEEDYRSDTNNQKMHALEKEIGDPSNFDSKTHPIFIAVNHMGHSYVMEGNHRLEYARKHGISHIHTEVRYFNGGEAVDKQMHPDKLKKLHIE